MKLLLTFIWVCGCTNQAHMLFVGKGETPVIARNHAFGECYRDPNTIECLPEDFYDCERVEENTKEKR